MKPSAVRVELVRTPIDVVGLSAETEAPEVGAIATFVGTVRAETNFAGRRLRGLEYSAYESMAAGAISQICGEARERFEVVAVRAVHRIGKLLVGEVSIAVVVSAAHRGPAFEACRAIMERIKADAPIFKQELWEGGESSWVNGL